MSLIKKMKVWLETTIDNKMKESKEKNEIYKKAFKEQEEKELIKKAKEDAKNKYSKKESDKNEFTI